MSNMDLFISLLGTADIKKKIAIGGDIIAYLNVPDNSMECEDIGGFIDGLVPWLQNSNFKVSQNGLDILGLLVGRLNEDFRPYLSFVVPSIIDRLGDAKDSVREKAHELLTHLMRDTCQPQQLFERLVPAFSHKNAKVREEVMLVFQETLNTHGVASLSVSKIVPSLVRLLSDPTPPVRDAAFNSLVEVYKHVGERVRLDLQKKQNVPPTK